MKIGIDARFYGLQHAGLGRYTKNLISELEKIDSENEYYIFLGKDNFQSYAPQNANFHKVILFGHPYSILSQAIDWFLLYRLGLDLIHFTHFSYPLLYRKKFVVTIHDLIKNQFHDKGASTRSLFMYKVKHWGYELVTRCAISRSVKIITPTNFVKEELIKSYHIDASKIIPVYEGAEDKFYNTYTANEKDVLEKYSLHKKYLIYVGNVYPYKNVEKLLEVMEALIAKNLQLAVVCSRSVFYERLVNKIKEKNLGDHVKMLGFVPDEDLAVLYRNALAFITASLSEGFGITGIEAMSAGCPVLSSNKTCLPEVYGEAAIYFDPTNVSEIVSVIVSILDDPALRHGLIEKGKKQAKRYSWVTMAKEIHAVYEESKTI